MKIDILQLEVHGDENGSLISLEQNKNIPFEIKRVYYIFDTKTNVKRGMHAHKDLKQVVVAVRGSCKFLLDNGNERETVVLNKPTFGLLIESRVWREMYDFSEDCVLMVLANNYYDESDYIRNYEEFIKVK